MSRIRAAHSKDGAMSRTRAARPAPAAGARGAAVRAGVLVLLAAAPGTGAVQETAAPVRLEARADRQAITIGDPIEVTLTLTSAEEARITSFAPESALGDLALLGRRAEPPVKGPGGTRIEKRILKITVYDVGRFEIPAFEADWEVEGKSGKAASTPIPFTVASVLPAGDGDPADIKPPAEMPERRWWPWLLAALVAAAAAAAWWWSRRRRAPAAAAPAPPAPALPADERAYADLGRLMASGLLERGEVKAFYIELVEILRRYLGERFAVETFERTSEEILEALRAARLPLRPWTATAEFFGACDLVKFAKYLPSPDETRATVERAYRLIDETRPPRPAEAEAGAARAAGGAA